MSPPSVDTLLGGETPPVLPYDIGKGLRMLNREWVEVCQFLFAGLAIAAANLLLCSLGPEEVAVLSQGSC